MSKSKLQIKENFSGSIQLETILVPIIFPSVSINNDNLYAIIMPPQRGIDYELQ